MKDLLEILAFLALGVLLTLACGVGLAFTVAAPTCHASTASMNIESRWGLLEGCLVEVEPGNWIPLENYQYVEAEVRPAD